jgi:hypothetical protein
MNPDPIDRALVEIIMAIGAWMAVAAMITAAIITLLTRKRKPKAPECTCYFVKDAFLKIHNPYCPVHGMTRSAVKAIGRHGN